MFVNVTAPVFHAGFEVFRQHGNYGVNVGAVFFVGVNGVLALELELSAL